MAGWMSSGLTRLWRRFHNPLSASRKGWGCSPYVIVFVCADVCLYTCMSLSSFIKRGQTQTKPSGFSGILMTRFTLTPGDRGGGRCNELWEAELTASH